MIVTSTSKRGYDAWVDSGNPNAKHGSATAMQLKTATKLGYLWLPISPLVAGRTIPTATLTGHAHGALDAQTFTLAVVTDSWQAGNVTWANQPGIGTTLATAVLGAPRVDGAEVTFDARALVQYVADGNAHFGWQVSTSVATTEKLVSFDSGDLSWTLEYTYDEAPDAPTNLAPNGTVVGAQKPVVTFDFTEYGATAGDLAYVRVEVDTNGDGTVDWDSGWDLAVDPSMDLAAAGMTGTISSGQTVKWRAYVKDSTGASSPVSAWATYTYRPLPGLVLDSPAAGVMYDPTSDVLAHITGAGRVLEAYRVQVTDGDDRSSVRYDSKKQPASDPTNIAHALPLRNDEGSRIFSDDHDYQIHVRAWDTDDRQATPGLATHVDVWATVHFDDNLALAKVSSFQAKQIDQTPFVQLTWTDVAAADAYLISRDDIHIARVTSADVVAGVSTYSTVDQLATPYDPHVYSIRRITTGVGRSAARQSPIRIKPTGIWLLRDNGDSVWLKGDGIDQLVTSERRLTYAPMNVPYTVDIITGLEGISGPLQLTVKDETTQSIHYALRVLSDIKDNLTEPVRLIMANVSKPILVKNLTVLPHSDFQPDTRKHRVDFDVIQVGEFDHRVH